jgi:rRNA-processing protein FCF1
MYILIDADCLIKLTKAGLKENVIKLCHVIIPKIVYSETVNAGMQKNCYDAEVIQKNIQKNRIQVETETDICCKGDEALIGLFSSERYDCVATDDKKLTNRLIRHNIPYVLPATLIYILYSKNRMTLKESLEALDKLSGFISQAEYSSIKLLFWRRK